jgi:proteasome alpha subunit
MHADQTAYDRASTVFSPDGRLFQVEYAREAVKRGTTAVGLKYKDGVVLIIDKRISSKLVEAVSVEKIFRIEGHVGCATSGLVADARVLVDRARVESQMHRMTYNEQIPVEVLVKKICDLMQNYTQYGGIRPFGTSLLVAGADGQGTHLFETDPSGALMAYKACSIGAGRNAVMTVFEEKYKDDLSLEAAIALGMEAMRKASEGQTKPETVEIGLVQTGESFRKLEPEDVASRLGKGK